MNTRLLLVLVALCTVFVSVNGQRDGYSYVCASLTKFQAADGGFSAREDQQQGQLEQTADAALLVALYGLNEKIRTSEVSSFINDLQNGDGGFSKQLGDPSDAASTRYATIALSNLELELSEPENTANFLRSLFDDSAGLFSGAHGLPGDIEATFNVLHSLDVLQALDTVEPLNDAVIAQLRTASKGDHFEFPGDTEGKLNFFGVLVGHYVNYDFGGDKQPYIRYLKSLGSASGGFSGYPDGPVTYSTSAQAAHALNVLGGPSAVYAKNLVSYAHNSPRSLKIAGKAHLIVLCAGATHQYRLEATLERADNTPLVKGSVIVQGVAFRSVVHLENTYNVMRTADVQAHVQFGEAKTTSELRFSSDRRSYVSVDLFDTENKLGPIKFQFVAVKKIGGYPDLVVTDTRQMSIGFGINVVSSATLEITGRDISEGDTVALGTVFKYDVSLHRADRKRFTSGDFKVTMLVSDSSQVTLARQTLDASTASELTFSWTLEDQNLPPGQLVFRFEVSSGDGPAHTVHDVFYKLNVPAVASQIAFEGFSRDQAPVFKLGEQVVVSFVPASFPDLRAVHPFRVTDVDGNQVLDKRQFYLDLRSGSPSSPPTQSIKGKVVDDKYVFTLDLEPRFEAIGTHFVSFRYYSAQEKDFQLQAYDSFFGELLEDTSSLNYTVNAELHFTDVDSQPKGKDFYYGNDITLVFKVKDTISGSYIRAIEDDQSQGGARVFLSLQHPDPVRDTPFTSATADAVVSGKEQFSILYKITPNAVRGPGQLVISARGSNVDDIPLLNDEGKRARFDIEIGGEIDVASSTFSTDNPDSQEAVFAAHFTLSCEGNALDNALLSANVESSDGTVLARNLIVGSFHDAYEVSWTTEHSNVPEGTYTLKFYRDTDKKRVAEGLEYYERKLKQNQKLIAAGQKVTEVLEKPTLSPLFTIDIEHDGIGMTDFPVSPELIAVSVLLSTFAFLWWKKESLE